MFVNYNDLPETSRVWIYQADRRLTDEEIDIISVKASDFVKQWTRHGDDLKGSFTFKYSQFLILGVDEGFNNVSGCSIDSSVKFIQLLEQELQLDLMNKLNVTFKTGDDINIVTLADFKKYASEHKITSDTIVFNNMVQTKAEMITDWEVPASKSWHHRFLN